jgi:hypothetical protein
MLFASCLHAQEFEWAYLIDNLNANEVAGLDTDESGNVYLCGVYGDDSFLPYDGEVYLTKTNPDGEVLWTKYLGSELIVGDLICAGEHIFIAVQSTAEIHCNGAVFSEAPEGAFMAIIILEQQDGSGFVQYYPENHGQNASLATDGEVVALQCAGQFNSGEFVIFFDSAGNELAYHALDIEANINDIAYHDGNTFLSGHTNFPQSVVIDNVNIPAGEIDGLTFILGFDENFNAQWGYADDALNAQDGQVVADASGIYSYQTTIDAGFQTTPYIWKLDVNGNLLDSVVAPTFTSAVTLYPDMAISDCHVLLFASNAFDNDSHELTLFDHDLNIIDEKQINGNSNLYSGQVATFENQIYVSHVHMDELDFNGEVEITDDLDDAFQYPYLAKVAVGENCGPAGECSIGEIMYEYSECIGGSFFLDIWFDTEGVSESFSVFGNGNEYGTFDYGAPFYSIGPFEAGSSNNYELIIFDIGFESCSNFIEFLGHDCGIGDCGIFELEVFEMDCDTDSTFSFYFNAEIIDPGNDFLEVWVNGDSYGFFEIADLPIQIGGVIPYDIEWQVLEICVNDQPDCCTELVFIAPLCLDTVNCFIGEINYELWDCIDGEFFVDIWFDYNNTTGFFDVYSDGEFYGNFEYGADFYTIGPFPSGSDVVYEFIVSDSGLDACVNFFEFQGINCSTGDCAIFDLEVEGLDANDDGTYSFVFNAEILDPGNDFIDVWINNEYIGFFPISELPIEIESATPSGLEWENLQICVNDNDSCCSSIEYLRPDSIPNGLVELDQFFSIFPNPATDLIEVKVSSEHLLKNIELYDVHGRLLLRWDDMERGVLDISALDHGVYLIVLSGYEGKSLSRRLVK